MEEYWLLYPAFVVVIWSLIILEVRAIVWTMIFALATLSLWLLNLPPLFPCILLTSIMTVTAALLACPWFRRQTITRWFFRWFKKVLPPVSETERAALEAGDIWWEAELFCGRPNWKKMLDLSAPGLTTEEQQFIANQTKTLCGQLDDWQITHQHCDLPKEVWDYIIREKFFAMHIPKAWGGLGFSATANSEVVQRIAMKSLSAAVTIMVPNSLGPAELLLKYGTEAQKKQYLPRLASGDEIPCFALTGVDAGSDAGSITDTGVVCKQSFQGQDVLGIELNWDKRYITLAPVATLLGLAFKLFDPNGLLGDKKELGITVCLVPTNLAGVEIGSRHLPLNQAFMNGPTRGKNVFVPLDFVIGGQQQVGQGWRMLMDCLSVGRGISLPAVSSGVAKQCYRTTGAYANVRKQFKVSIGQFEGVAEALGRIGGFGYAMEATRLMTLLGIEQGIKPAVVSAIAKYHMTEMSRSIMNDAMDVHGGRGIIMGPRNYLARTYQGIPISITVEGANILTRSLIIFGQGAIRCHPFVFNEMMAAGDADQKNGLKVFDRLFFAHLNYNMANFARMLTHSLTGGLFCRSPKNGKLAKYYRRLSYMSLCLACLSDVAMLKLGGSLKRKENLSARLGDVLSYLYIASAVLKYHHDQGRQNEDLPYVQWCLETYLYRMQEAVISFLDNFPHRVSATFLRQLFFPLGRKFSPPKDQCALHIRDTMLVPSALRDRLTAMNDEKPLRQDNVGRVDYALLLKIKAEPCIKKLEKAIKQGQLPKEKSWQAMLQVAVEKQLLTPEDATLLQSFEEARLDAIHVDEFDSIARN